MPKGLVESYEYERTALREELHNLKGCQITFLTSTVTATGVLLGVSATFAKSAAPGLIWFLPLLVIVSFWWIFFDKATTITRIVGYYRNLELLILGHQEAKNYRGWENSLGEFRNDQDKIADESDLQEKPNAPVRPFYRAKLFMNMVVLRTGYGYLVIVNYVFAGLALTCLILGIKASGINAASIIALAIFLLSILRNFHILFHLIYGKHSYKSNTVIWENVLKVRPSNATLGEQHELSPQTT